MSICLLPQLIAACHVLHRLREPRHPSCALLSFPFSFALYDSTSDIRRFGSALQQSRADDSSLVSIVMSSIKDHIVSE